MNKFLLFSHQFCNRQVKKNKYFSKETELTLKVHNIPRTFIAGDKSNKESDCEINTWSGKKKNSFRCHWYYNWTSRYISLLFLFNLLHCKIIWKKLTRSFQLVFIFKHIISLLLHLIFVFFKNSVRCINVLF